MQYRGVFTALITPFHQGGVDYDRFRTLCQRQLDAGIHGLVPCGTTGETPTLTLEEWRQLITIAVECAAGRVPVVAGCGTNATASSQERLRQARELGANAGLLVLPYYNKPPADGQRAHVAACAAEGLPLVLYHVPGRTAQRVAPSLLAQLSAQPGVVAIKEATGDLGYANDLLAATTRPVLSGDDGTFYPLVALGGAGVISVVSNAAPRATIALYEAAQRGDLDEARRLHFQLLPLVRWLFHTTSPIPAKALLAGAGLCAHELRLPLTPLQTPVPAELLALVEA